MKVAHPPSPMVVAMALFTVMVPFITSQQNNPRPKCLCTGSYDYDGDYDAAKSREEVEAALVYTPNISIFARSGDYDEPDKEALIQEKIEAKLEAALKENSGADLYSLFQRCGARSCRNNPLDTMCVISSRDPYQGGRCPWDSKICHPLYGYNTQNQFRIIVQAPRAGFEQCIWQHFCSADNEVCSRYASCRQSAEITQMLTFDPIRDEFACDSFYRCCTCTCSRRVPQKVIIIRVRPIQQ